MKTIQFDIEIAAPVAKVWDTMLAPDTYTRWTAPFCEGSYFEGSWTQGERIRFLAPSGGGMLAELETVRPHELVSIRHIGVVENGAEDTTSEAVRAWAPAYEKFAFAEVAGGTRVTIEQDVAPDFEQFMQDTWPAALAELKRICEGG